MIRFELVALLFGLGMLVAVDSPASAQQSGPSSPLVVLLASDRTAYDGAAAVTFTIAVDNPTNAPVTLTFPSGQIYDLAVSAGDAEVWRWSADRAFTQALSERSFPPGLTLLGRETWNWVDNGGSPLPSGTYRVVGAVASSPPQSGNPVEVELRAP
jgi:hypothetical protein